MEYLETENVLEQYAFMLLAVLPPPRLDNYESTNFAVIKNNVLSYIDEIVEAMGTFPVHASTSLLEEMQIFSAVILFLGLIFNIVLILFVIISILLIYSLLMITTETKTFDTGIMRLLGLSSGGFIAMIFIQGIFFVIPSIIIAYICAYPANWYMYKKLFANDFSDGSISYVPGATATIEAVGIGLLIPTLSSIIPIQRSLSKTLGESLNTARSTLSGTIIIIESKGMKVVPYIVFGLICVIFGVTIYVVLPQALLTENVGLILNIFFAILGCLILGLTLLSVNLRGAVEWLVTYLLFFWEKKSMITLLKKNLMAHKHTNKLTSMIYALTLGCVIFLCVSLNLVLLTVTSSSGYPGSDITLKDGYFHPAAFTSILQEYGSTIKSFAYVTVTMNEMRDDDVCGLDYGSNLLLDDAQMYETETKIQGINPSSLIDNNMQMGFI